MDVHVAGVWEVILKFIADMDGTSCGREGLAAAAKQQQQRCHAFCQWMEQITSAEILHKLIWEKLINEQKVRVQPRFLAQSPMQYVAANW